MHIYWSHKFSNQELQYDMYLHITVIIYDEYTYMPWKYTQNLFK